MALMNPARPKQDGASNSEAAADPQARRPGPMKFQYASGDQPLDGYTIRRGIGRGGFGEVYFAESDAGKEVAMKLIRRNLDVELRGVRHCLNLKHPNLIALYDIRADSIGDEWVIMEYVSGVGGGANSLEEALDRAPKGLSEEEVLRWMRGIAAGVAHLHDNGIVHRDLKPGNIFLDGETVKIGDYGLSKFISCSRRSGQTESVGTVHYMAPEIANGRYGREIDTYALGVILYEMLTGHVPFEGESVGEVLMKHLTAEPDLQRVEEPYREIVRRALAKDPELRIRSVGQLEAMLPGGSSEAIATGSPAAEEPIIPVLDTAAPLSADPRQPKVDPHAHEEPIFRSISEGWSHFWANWHDSPMNPAIKALIVIVAICFLVFSGVAWLPALISLGVFYCIYYVIWSAFLQPSTTTNSVLQEPHMRPAKPPEREKRHTSAAERRRRRLGWRDEAWKHLAEKPLRTKATELIGSMLMSTALCTGGSLLATLLLEGMIGSGREQLVFLWLAMVTTLGCWAVLVTNKLTEGRVEDQTPMRGLLLSLGAGVGLVAGLLSVGLPVGLPHQRDYGPELNNSFAHEMWDFPGVTSLLGIDGGLQVTVPLSVAYFAFLFVMLRWWKQAEWMRNKRLSLLSVFGCVFWAWLLHIFWWFPQPTGMAVAAIIATSTQLASPWLPPSKREEFARKEVA